MCKPYYRTLYTKDTNGHVHSLRLVYDRLDEKEIKSYYEEGSAPFPSDFTLWLLGKLSGTPHVPTIVKTVDKFFTAEVLGNRARWQRHAPRENPRYVTVLTLVDGQNNAIAGGSSVCSAVDEPDRAVGYRLAFERLKDSLKDLGYSVISKAEGEKALE